MVLPAPARVAQPAPGSVKDVRGRPCPAAIYSDYPLYAECSSCGRVVRVADGSADWVHTSDYRAFCSSESAFGAQP